MAFRSVPRPSSPPGAKASTERPSHAHSHANDKPKFVAPILHRNHPTRPSTCRTYPYPYAAPTKSLREQRPGRDGRAIKHIHSLHASEHLPVAGTWVARATLLRSDLQPARPDAPNPDSHVKRTNPAFRRRLGHTRDHRSDRPVRAPLNAHTISFSLRDDRLSNGDPIGIACIPMGTHGGGRYRTDDPLLAKQVLSH